MRRARVGHRCIRTGRLGCQRERVRVDGTGVGKCPGRESVADTAAGESPGMAQSAVEQVVVSIQLDGTIGLHSGTKDLVVGGDLQ